MSYSRVIPRDLFNEGNLLKCYGALYIELENTIGHKAELVDNLDGSEPFKILQSYLSGAIWIDNVALEINGKRHNLWRPLNSREPWPLYCSTEPEMGEETGDEIEVFTEGGKLSADFLALITGA